MSPLGSASTSTPTSSSSLSGYDCVADEPDEDMHIWIVNPIPDSSAVIHLDAIVHYTYLVPVFRHQYVDQQLKFTPYNSLVAFQVCLFYAKEYADYHSHGIVFYSFPFFMY